MPHCSLDGAVLAPIQRSLLAGDIETGVTIMEVVPALDAGAMVSKGVVPITERDTAQSLHDEIAHIGAELMLAAMERLAIEGSLPATPQDETLVTYASKLQKSEAAINWTHSANLISRQVRAFNPFPVAHAMLKREVCRIWMATFLDTPVIEKPGMILDVSSGVQVACGDGVLVIEELQSPGGKRLKAKDFVTGHGLKIGQYFE
jgi:methionyl-tRNA formyltransferase